MSAGGGGTAAVVNDQTAPALEPLALRAITCQKYVLPAAIAGEYDVPVWPVTTWGGGFVVPNFTSKLVALWALHDNVAVVLTSVARFAGFGEDGVPGGLGSALVVNDQMDPALVPPAFRAVTCQ